MPPAGGPSGNVAEAPPPLPDEGHEDSFDPGLETGYRRRGRRDHELPVEIGASPFNPGPERYDGRRAKRAARRREKAERKQRERQRKLEVRLEQEQRRESERREREQAEEVERRQRAAAERVQRAREQTARVERERREREAQLEQQRQREELERAEAERARREQRQRVELERAERIERERAERVASAAAEQARRERERRAADERKRREAEKRKRREADERKRAARVERERAQRDAEQPRRAPTTAATRRASTRAPAQPRTETRREALERQKRAREARRRRGPAVVSKASDAAEKTATRARPRGSELRRPTAKAGLALAAVVAFATGMGALLGLPVPGLGSGSDSSPSTAAGDAALLALDSGTPVALTKGPYFPVVGEVGFGEGAARFGAPRSGHIHEGQDVFAKPGTPLVAVRDGVVLDGAGGESFYATGGGNTLVVYSPLDNRSYVYLHLLKPALVGAGERVAAGQPVGQLGCTGSCDGPHLHFEVRNGRADFGAETKAIDPLPLLKQWPQRPTG